MEMPYNEAGFKKFFESELRGMDNFRKIKSGQSVPRKHKNRKELVRMYSAIDSGTETNYKSSHFR